MMETALHVEHLQAGYEKKVVVPDASFDIPKGKIVSIIGPNGCGKSTVLRSITGHLPIMAGKVELDGRPLQQYGSKLLARKIACLSQTNASPEDMTVRRLVGFGRVPHRKWGFSLMTDEDRRAIDDALRFTGADTLEDSLVGDLSGGERQRVWLAMVIAQEPDILLLDEPTTYLDVSHQLEIMELLRHLNKMRNTTIAMVLHDLNQAMKYSDQVVVMNKGSIYSTGTPTQVCTERMLEEVHGLKCDVGFDDEGSVNITSMSLSRKLSFNV